MRLLFPALLLVLLPSGRDAAAQLTLDRGFKLGLNATTVRVDADEARVATAYRTGFVAGVYAEFELLGPLTLHPEVLLSQKGATVELLGPGGFARLSAIYIEVPALFRLSLPTPLTPYVVAGPAFAVKATENAEPRDGFRASNLFRRSDLGLAVGAGLDVRTGGRSLSLGVRLTTGLNNVMDGSRLGLDDMSKSHAVSFMAGIGL